VIEYTADYSKAMLIKNSLNVTAAAAAAATLARSK